MSEIEMLQEQRKVAWKLLKASHDMKVRAETLLIGLKHRYEHDLKEYEKIDHALALIDGRAQRVVAITPLNNRKSRPVVDLTEEQIIAIARQLGLILPEVEEEVSNE